MAKNTAPNSYANPTVNDEEEPDFSTWDKEQTGFAPYWEPAEGLSAFASAVALDMNDPEQPRFLLRNEGKELRCFQGSKLKKQQLEVMVKKGENFTISVYHSISSLLETYLASGLHVRFKLTAVEKVPTSTTGREVWKWDLVVDPAVRAQLAMFKTKAAVNGTLPRAAKREQLQEG